MASSAKNTAPAESSQALFCAIADHLGKTEYFKLVKDIMILPKKDRIYDAFKASISEKDLNASFEKTETFKTKGNKFKLEELEDFLDKEVDWFISSLLIAEKILKFINKASSKFNLSVQDLYYERGDDAVMGNIAELFELANSGQKIPKKNKNENAVAAVVKTPVFGDINKWCPADIYFASDEAKEIIKKNLNDYKPAGSPVLSFDSLNGLISDMIASGDLLPVSLKKTTTSVHLVFVNFRRSREEEMLRSLKFSNVSNWIPLKMADYKKLQAIKLNRKYELDTKDKLLIKNLPTRDIKLNFTEKTGQAEIKIRHDPSGSGSIKAEYKGRNAEARGGSVVSLDILCYLFSLVDKQLAKDFKSAWFAGSLEFRNRVRDLGPNPGEGANAKEKALKELYNDKRGGMSAYYVTNEALPIIKDWVETNSKKKLPGTKDTKVDLLIRRIYEYVTSRTDESSKFIIAK
jgi:hypothetical protein